MQIVIAAESLPGENRVAVTPETVKKLLATGNQIRIESGAGRAAAISDLAYTEAGAQIVSPSSDFLAQAELLLAVRAPSLSVLEQLPEGAAIVAMFDPYRFENFPILESRKLSAFALELAPRITRAQAMDVLSSQANIAGYRAVLLATHYYPRFMPMLMTAAGTVKPARVLIMGAGVAGLQAIATARRLGAVVEAFDVRAAAKEQVESLGAKFVEVPISEDEKKAADGVYAREMSDDYKQRQAQLIAARAKEADIIITTALIPGRSAPILIPSEVVATMKPGSVIIDLAVEQGGNCPLSRKDKVVTTEQGVLIIGHGNLPSLVAADASALYARNVLTFLGLAIKDGSFAPSLEDEIISATLIAHAGQIRFKRPA